MRSRFSKPHTSEPYNKTGTKDQTGILMVSKIL